MYSSLTKKKRCSSTKQHAIPKEFIHIGIVVNYKAAERKKKELLNIRSRKMPWLARAEDPKYNSLVIHHTTIRGVEQTYVASDIAIGLYIESYYPLVKVDYITPDEISVQRFRENDLVFVIIYDLLEAFHLSDTEIFKNYEYTLQHSSNVYPPYEYQRFVNSKCSYYTYLEKNGITIAPTFCSEKPAQFTKNPDTYIKKLLDNVKEHGWSSFVTKPLYGQEAIGFSKFINVFEQPSQLRKAEEYLKKNIPLYKSIVFQKYIEGFDLDNPEIRTYFINGVYAYSIITTHKLYAQSIYEGGTYKKLSQDEWDFIMVFAKKVMRTLPTFSIRHSKPVLTRIDIGSGLDKTINNGYFVNEIEFVPSLYIDNHNYPILEKISDTLVKIAKEYKQADTIDVFFKE